MEWMKRGANAWPSLTLFLAALAASLLSGCGASSAYDARLSGVDYPFDVKVRAFEAQRQALEMAYMDLQPDDQTQPTVLLLHGKNFSGAYWEETAKDLLAEGHRVIIPDQIGFGKSSKPTHYQYSFAAMAQQSVDLLDHLGVDQVVVVGHSMGGMLATRLSLDHSEVVLGLALVNPIGLEDWATKVPYAPVEAVYQAELQKTPEKVREYMKVSYFDGQWRPEYESIAALQMQWSQSPDKDQLAYVAALTADMVFTQPVVHDFARIAVPTLLIIGTRDRTALGKGRVDASTREELGRYEVLGKAAAAAIPNAQLVELPGIGHMPQVEAYDDYIAALKAFVAAP